MRQFYYWPIGASNHAQLGIMRIQEIGIALYFFLKVIDLGASTIPCSISVSGETHNLFTSLLSREFALEEAHKGNTILFLEGSGADSQYHGTQAQFLDDSSLVAIYPIVLWNIARGWPTLRKTLTSQERQDVVDTLVHSTEQFLAGLSFNKELPLLWEAFLRSYSTNAENIISIFKGIVNGGMSRKGTLKILDLLIGASFSEETARDFFIYVMNQSSICKQWFSEKERQRFVNEDYNTLFTNIVINWRDRLFAKKIVDFISSKPVPKIKVIIGSLHLKGTLEELRRELPGATIEGSDLIEEILNKPVPFLKTGYDMKKLLAYPADKYLGDDMNSFFLLQRSLEKKVSLFIAVESLPDGKVRFGLASKEPLDKNTLESIFSPRVREVIEMRLRSNSNYNSKMSLEVSPLICGSANWVLYVDIPIPPSFF